MRKYYRFGLAFLLIAFLALPAMPDHRRVRLSSTKSFAIDGRYFSLNIPGVEVRQADPVFAVEIQEVGKANTSNLIPLPQGLREEHSLKMESDSGPVEIAIGTMDAGGPQIRGRMCSSGWECLELGEEHTSLASRKKVGETTIVLLDEKEGKFLLLRRQE